MQERAQSGPLQFAQGEALALEIFDGACVHPVHRAHRPCLRWPLTIPRAISYPPMRWDFRNRVSEF